jgi:hypothetical protein
VTAQGLHWDAKAGHGDGLEGESRDMVVRYAGTGSTRGSTKWLEHERQWRAAATVHVDAEEAVLDSKADMDG